MWDFLEGVGIGLILAAIYMGYRVKKDIKEWQRQRDAELDKHFSRANPPGIPPYP